MSLSTKIGIFGGDLRLKYLAASLLDKGYPVITYCIAEEIEHQNHSTAHTLNELFENSKVLIGPVPMSRDQVTVISKTNPSDLTIAHIAYLLKDHHVFIGGNIPAPITDICSSKNILVYDLFKDEKITILNAIATAEGTIMEAITHSDRNLHGSNGLILGYGRCAKILAAKLKALDVNVTIAARSEEALAFATAAGLNAINIKDMKCILPSYHYIFNTIPSLILDKGCLDLVNKEVSIIDIASAPGGVDFEYAKKLNLNARLSLGLPGKVSPRSSADIMSTEITAFLKKEVIT